MRSAPSLDLAPIQIGSVHSLSKVSVWPGPGVAVGVAVGVCVGLPLGDGVGVIELVEVAVAVAVAVGVAVGPTGVEVGVAVGAAPPTTQMLIGSLHASPLNSVRLTMLLLKVTPPEPIAQQYLPVGLCEHRESAPHVLIESIGNI
jgi:hypothetical protein